MTPLLPPVSSEAEYLAVTREPARRRAVADAVALRHDFPQGDPTAFAGGSLLVLALEGQRVLKLYSPLDPEDWEREVAALRAIEGRLPAPTPRVLATGDLDGWPYLVMSRLEGHPANARWIRPTPADDTRAAPRVLPVPENDPWQRLPRAEQLRVAVQTGAATSALHRVPVEALPESMRPNWGSFLAAQRDTCVARMRARGLSEAWLAQIPAFLDAVELRPPEAGVLLHTEIMRDHVFVARTNSEDARTEGEARWDLTGILDFEPAMVGDPEYDFASVAVFLAAGDPELLGAFFDGYGLRREDQTLALARRVLAYLLLHRYGDLNWALSLMPPPPAPTLDALAQALCP